MSDPIKGQLIGSDQDASGTTGSGSGPAATPAILPPPEATPATPPSPEATLDAAQDTASSETNLSDAAASPTASTDGVIVDPVKTKDPSPETGRLMVMAPSSGRNWDDIRIDKETSTDRGAGTSQSRRRRMSALVAVAVIGGIAGAIGTAMAIAGASYVSGGPEQASAGRARMLDESITRIETELAALRTNIDRSAKQSAAQAGKVNERFDRIEKAQSEPTAKIAKLTETVDKLRMASVVPAAAPAQTSAPSPAAAAPPAVAPTAAAREPTGSIPATSSTPKPETARLPTLEGWALRDAGNGSAVIESRAGIYEVYAGDPVPGLGRIDAIRRQDGRWVVVTSKGLIVAR